MRRYRRGQEQWQVSLDESTVLIEARGPGSTPVEETRRFRSALRAQWEVDRLCSQREADGYELVERDDEEVGFSHEVFERALQEDPDNVENHLVHADWLQSQGDARGELIMLQHALMNAPRRSERFRQLSRMEAELLFRHRRQLWGTLGERVIDEGLQLYATELFTPEWFLGSVRTVAFRLLDLQLPAPMSIGSLLPAFFALPMVRTLRGFAVHVHSSRPWPGVEDVLELLSERSPSTLRWVTIGHTDDWHQPPLVRLTAAAPPVQRLSLCAQQLQLADDLPHQVTAPVRELELSCYRISNRLLQPLARAHWPALETLTLRIHPRVVRAESWHYAALQLLPLLSGERAPRLTSLTLHGTSDTDELCRVLADSPLAAGLRHLDLSFGALGPVGVEILSARPFPALQTLVVQESPLDPSDARRLERAAPRVQIHPLLSEWDDS